MGGSPVDQQRQTALAVTVIVAVEVDDNRRHKQGHKERGPRKHLVLGEPTREEPRRPDHQHEGRNEENLEHERLPGLAALRIGKWTREDFLGIDEHAHLHKRCC